MRIAVIDSGIRGVPVAGGISFVDETYSDELGHGSWVAATILRHAPESSLYAVKIFGKSLDGSASTLARAILWAARDGIPLINLSLGARDARQRGLISPAVAAASQCTIVAAHGDGTEEWLPGILDGVLGVRIGERFATDGSCLLAPDTPAPVPGIPPACRPAGISFATANATGRLAATWQPGISRDAWLRRYASCPQS